MPSMRERISRPIDTIEACISERRCERNLTRVMAQDLGVVTAGGCGDSKDDVTREGDGGEMVEDADELRRAIGESEIEWDTDH